MKTIEANTLNYYATPGRLTNSGDYEGLLKSLPASVGELVEVVHHLGIYDVVAEEFYNVVLSEDRKADIHLRSGNMMLERILAIDDRPLSEARPPDERIACRCHAFTRLIVMLLRSKGIPARARCGFATYFNPERYEDHWVCEYWNDEKQRWVLLDAQLDEVWRMRLSIDWDVRDMSQERFLVAADAWTRCRDGRADPDHFGIGFYEGMYGLWFVAGNLVRDAAALNKMEMLPWDVWGAAPMPHTTFNQEELAFYDQLAALTASPDDTFDELVALYAGDERVRVPQTVFNNLRQQVEPVEAV